MKTVEVSKDVQKSYEFIVNEQRDAVLALGQISHDIVLMQKRKEEIEAEVVRVNGQFQEVQKVLFEKHGEGHYDIVNKVFIPAEQ